MVRVRKTILAVMTVLLMCSSSDAALFNINFQNPVMSTIKDEVEKQASAMMDREVKVGSVGGGLVGSVTINDIRVAKHKKLSDGAVISIKKATVHYNLVKAAVKKDFVAAISKIEIAGPDVYLEHERDGSWNLAKLMKSGDGGGEAPQFTAKIFLRGGRLIFTDKLGFSAEPLKKDFSAVFSGLNGLADFGKKGHILLDVSARTSKGSVKITGDVDLNKGSLKTKVSAKGFDLEEWNRYLGIPFVKDQDLKGLFDMELAASTPPAASAKGKIVFRNSMLYGRDVSGPMGIDVNDKKAKISFDDMLVSGGALRGSVDIGFGGKVPISGRMMLAGNDLALLSGGIAGVAGKISGGLELSGSASDLSVRTALTVDKGKLVGQSVSSASARLKVSSGNLHLETLEIASGRSKAVMAGVLEKGKKFDITASADGLDMYNTDFLGGIFGKLDKFSGKVSGTIGKELLAHPMLNLQISGEIALSKARIGAQKIDQASGSFSLKEGVISVGNFNAVNNGTRLLLNGNAGFGKPSRIELLGTGVMLSDITIADPFLPQRFRGISGKADIRVVATGMLPKDETATLERMFRGVNVSAEATAKEILVAGEVLDAADISVLWENGLLSRIKTGIKSGDSGISVEGRSDQINGLDATVKGYLNMVRLKPLTQDIANILGRVNISGKVSGSMVSPVLDADIDWQGFEFNSVKLDRVKGKIKAVNGSYQIYGPVVLEKNESRIGLTVSADLGRALPLFDVRATAESAGLKDIIELGQMLYIEGMQRASYASGSSKMVAITQKGPDIPMIGSFYDGGRYRLVTQQNGFLALWKKISDSAKELSMTQRPVEIDASGRTGFDVEVKVNGKDISAKVDVNAKNVKFSDMDLSEISLSGYLKDGAANIRKAELKRGSGKIDISGKIEIGGPIALKAYSKGFKLDKVNTAFGSPVQMEGVLDMGMAVGGSISSPSVSVEARVTKALFGDITLDSVNTRAGFNDNVLDIEKLEIRSSQQKASLKGRIPFDGKRQISADLSLDGNNIALLASVIRGVRWKEGKGSLSLKVSGTVLHPVFRGELKARNAVIDIDQIRSTLVGLDSEIILDGDTIRVNKLMGSLNGALTSWKSLPFSIAGTADLKELFGEKKVIDLNMKATDMSGSININGLYTGDAKLSNVSINGPLCLNMDITKDLKPLVKADAELINGLFSIPKGGGGNGKMSMPDMAFDINASVGKNVRLVQNMAGQTISVEFSQMDIEIFSDGIKVTGALSGPVITGVVGVGSGKLSILGRDFDILSEKDQEKYFSNNRTMMVGNKAEFLGQAGPAAALPNIYVTALSEVYEDTGRPSDSSTTVTGPAIPTKQKVAILTRITGIPFVQDKEKAMKLQFFAFVEDKAKGPMSYAPAPYSENDIRIMILPDFLKGTLGLSKGQGEAFDTNAVIVDFLNARLQSYLTKGISSSLEKAFGLDSFTLDYNFGRDLEKLLPTRRGDYAYADKPQLGIGLVKGFFDRIYIQLKYARAMEQTGQNNDTAVNYQITWKIDRYYSFAYYREPITFLDQNSTYYKMTLQYVYQF